MYLSRASYTAVWLVKIAVLGKAKTQDPCISAIEDGAKSSLLLCLLASMVSNYYSDSSSEEAHPDELYEDLFAEGVEDTPERSPCPQRSLSPVSRAERDLHAIRLINKEQKYIETLKAAAGELVKQQNKGLTAGRNVPGTSYDRWVSRASQNNPVSNSPARHRTVELERAGDTRFVRGKKRSRKVSKAEREYLEQLRREQLKVSMAGRKVWRP